MRARIPTAAVAVALLIAACGSSSSKGSTGSSNTTANATSTTAASGSTSSGKVDTGGASGSITVTGGDDFSGVLTKTNAELCTPRDSAIPGTASLVLSYAKPDSTRRELDIDNVKIGTTQVKPTKSAAGPSTTGGVRYSDYEENGGGRASDYFDWGGGTRSGTGTTSGTVTVTTKKAGSFTGDLAYAGDESQKYAASYRKGIHVVASWQCP